MATAYEEPYHRSIPIPVASELAQRSSHMYTQPEVMLKRAYKDSRE